MTFLSWVALQFGVGPAPPLATPMVGSLSVYFFRLELLTRQPEVKNALTLKRLKVET